MFRWASTTSRKERGEWSTATHVVFERFVQHKLGGFSESLGLMFLITDDNKLFGFSVGTEGEMSI